MEFVESFMKFSFEDDNIFLIEKDELVQSVEGRKACECVVLISENVALIEAKSSSPNPTNEQGFNAFIDDIRQKFADSLQLFTDMKSKRYGEDAYNRLPAKLQTASDDKSQYKIYLIIHGHKLDWLLELTDTLRDAMRDVIKQWNMRDSNVRVYNEETALENNLIVAYVLKADLPLVKQSNGNVDPDEVALWFTEHQNHREG